MASGDNGEVFDVTALAIFDRLRESFPCPVDLDVSALASGLFADEKSDDSWYHKVKTAEWVMVTLGEFGYLRYEEGREAGAFRGSRLTEKGLTLLNAIPSSIESTSRIDKLRSLFSRGVGEAGLEAVRQAIQSTF